MKRSKSSGDPSLAFAISDPAMLLAEHTERPASADPFISEVHQMNLPYLGFAGGVLPTGPDDLQTPNIEMWPLDQIYRLRSDLISLSVFIDEDDAAIQESIQSGFQEIVESLRAVEDEQPLRLRHLTFAQSLIRHDPVPRPFSPFPPLSHPRPSPVARSRSPSAHGRPRGEGGRSLTTESLWDNVDIFMRPIEKLAAIQRYLAPGHPVAERSILNEPLGPHYSITLPKSP